MQAPYCARQFPKFPNPFRFPNTLMPLNPLNSLNFFTSLIPLLIPLNYSISLNSIISPSFFSVRAIFFKKTLASSEKSSTFAAANGKATAGGRSSGAGSGGEMPSES